MFRRRFALGPAIAVAVVLTASCSGVGPSSSATTTITSASEVPPNPTSSTSVPVPQNAADRVLVSFPTQQSAESWVNIDDSVMGGVSDSDSSWEDGALVFAGVLSAENNGGFASTLGPADATIGARAAAATALRIDASGDGRSYLLQLRTSTSRDERWICRFTPAADGTSIVLITQFERVNRFLRPVGPGSGLDPSTIDQVGIYVLDGQVGDFRLSLRSITAVR